MLSCFYYMYVCHFISRLFLIYIFASRAAVRALAYSLVCPAYVLSCIVIYLYLMSKINYDDNDDDDDGVCARASV